MFESTDSRRVLSDWAPVTGAKLGQRLAKFDIGRTRLIDPGSVQQQVKVMTNFPQTHLSNFRFTKS